MILTRQELSAQRKEYRNFKANTLHPVCWACGRDETQIPKGWFGPWHIDRAHIVHSPRVEDRRLVVLLCRMDHDRFAGASIPSCPGHKYPRLTIGNLIWLKWKFDPEYFDRAFLQRYSVRRLPRAMKLPGCYREEYARRRPA